jgi:hypothetical protein
MSYTGYLSPFIDEIAAQRKAGKSFHQIAEQYMHLGTCTGPLVKYALERSGYLDGGLKYKRFPKIPPGTYIVYFKQPADRTNLGRPIDMGGPRGVWLERDPWSNF